MSYFRDSSQGRKPSKEVTWAENLVEAREQSIEDTAEVLRQKPSCFIYEKGKMAM